MPYQPQYADLARRFCLPSATNVALAPMFEVPVFSPTEINGVSTMFGPGRAPYEARVQTQLIQYATVAAR